MTGEQAEIELACWTIMDREGFAPRTAQHTAAVICLAPHIEKGLRAAYEKGCWHGEGGRPFGETDTDPGVTAGTTAMRETL